MNYIEFKERTIDYLRNRMDKSIDISSRPITKNNGVVLDGIIVRYPGEAASPTLYVEQYYDEYLKGIPFGDLCEMMINVLGKHSEYYPDVRNFNEFDEVKKGVVYKLIHREMNEELLKEIPHKIWNDLAIVYLYILPDEIYSQASILIRNEHLNMWNIDEDTLYRTACLNTPNLMPAMTMTMESVLEEMLAQEEELDSARLCDTSFGRNMYVLTNRNRSFGATAMLYSDEIARISRRYECGLYIMPSSVHEVILMPSTECDDETCLRQLIMDVNETEVDLQDKLSDSLYYYDPVREEIRIVAC